MKKNVLALLTTIVVGTMIIFSACEKKEENAELLNTKSAQDEAMADMIWNSVDSDVDLVSNMFESKSFKSATADTCPTIIIDHPDSTFFPRTLIIDFGTDYCETWEGRPKKGKIIITVNRPIYEMGSVRTVTFEDFYIADHKVEGINTLTNNGFNNSGNLNFQAALSGGKITFPDGGIVTRDINHNREWIIGIQTPQYWWDDQWHITGTASGTNRDGVSYNNLITTPVLYKTVCHFPVSGIIDLNINNVGTLVMDYGDGECDNLATITFGDTEWTITLN